jgi:hypothetical protein
MLHKDERSLVQKFEGQPFVILGVNNDPDPATLRATQREQHITWRSWWDEDGSITRQWDVEGFPTLILIDPTGKVRWMSPGKPPADLLRKKIDTLLQELRPTT